MTYNSQTTAAIAFDAAATTGANSVRSWLEALSSIGSGNVAVTGAAGGPYTVTFQGTLAKQDVTTITANGSGLTGPGAQVAVENATIGNKGVQACFKKTTGNTLTTPQSGDALSITINAPYKLGFGFLPLSPITLKGRSTMRIEQIPSGFTATDVCPP